MFEGLFQPFHLLVILVIALLIFGPRKLSDIGGSLGKSMKGFKKALQDPLDEVNEVKRLVAGKDDKAKASDRQNG